MTLVVWIMKEMIESTGLVLQIMKKMISTASLVMGIMNSALDFTNFMIRFISLMIRTNKNIVPTTFETIRRGKLTLATAHPGLSLLFLYFDPPVT